MKIDDLYSAIFAAINNKNIEQINNLLTNEGIELLSDSYLAGDGRYQELCLVSVSLDNKDIFLRLCAPALRLLERGDGFRACSDSVARVFLPALIKQLAWSQKKLFIDALVKTCIAEELKNFSLSQSKANLNPVAKINMIVAAVAAYSDISKIKGYQCQGALELKEEYAGLIKRSLDRLLDVAPGEQLNKKTFLVARQRTLEACFAEGATCLADEVISNDNYWFGVHDGAKKQDKTLGVALSSIAVGKLGLLQKFLGKTLLDQGRYAFLLKAAIIDNQEAIFNYIIFNYGKTISGQGMLIVMKEACECYDSNHYFFCCLLDCEWLSNNSSKRRALQLENIAYALAFFKDVPSELREALEAFAAEDMQLLKSINSKFYDNFCKELKSKYPHLFVKLMNSFAYKKVKDFMVELKDFVTLIDGGQQEIVFCFNDVNVCAQFMGEWHRKHGSGYMPSVELRTIKPDKNLEIIISKTVKLSLAQVEGFCEKIKALTEQVSSKLKPVIKKTNNIYSNRVLSSKVEKKQRRKEREAQKKIANDPLQRHKDPSEFKSSDLLPVRKIIGSNHDSHMQFLFFKQSSFFEWSSTAELVVSCNRPQIVHQ